MTDPDREPETDAERGESQYDVERAVSRADGATVLRILADGVANGSVEFGGDDEIVGIVPDRFVMDVAYGQGSEVAELDVGLVWQVVDGETVSVESASDVPRPETRSAAGSEPAPEQADDISMHELVGPGDTASKARFEIYRDEADEWRWRLVHDNGNIIADSGEGYDRKAGARKGMESVMRNAPGATVDVRDD